MHLPKCAAAEVLYRNAPERKCAHDGLQAGEAHVLSGDVVDGGPVNRLGVGVVGKLVGPLYFWRCHVMLSTILERKENRTMTPFEFILKRKALSPHTLL